jgi:hypothetical protein
MNGLVRLQSVKPVCGDDSRASLQVSQTRARRKLSHQYLGALPLKQTFSVAPWLVRLLLPLGRALAVVNFRRGLDLSIVYFRPRKTSTVRKMGYAGSSSDFMECIRRRDPTARALRFAERMIDGRSPAAPSAGHYVEDTRFFGEAVIDDR